MRPSHLALLLVTTWSVACSDDGDSATTNSTTTVGSSTTGSSQTSAGPNTSATVETDSTSSSSETTVEPTDSGSTTEDGGPMILSFGTNVNQITEGESVIFSAVVTDPDGIEDVIGGQLTSPDGGTVYGAFATAGMEGAYEISLSWAEIDQAESIEFEGLEDSREFRAEFFDQGGKKAAAISSLSLHCDGVAACSGACVDTLNDINNCGVCARMCDYVDGDTLYGEFGTCSEGSCQNTLGACFKAAPDLSTCSEYCADIGEACAANGCYAEDPAVYFTYLDFSGENICDGLGASQIEGGDLCDAPLPGGLSVYRCCCTDNV